MCARYTLKSKPDVVAAMFGLDIVPDLQPRYNVAPTQAVTAVREAGGKLACVPLRWGLVPSWAGDLKIGHSLLNARAETVASKPAFRAAFRRRRCLIVADGYFEWKAVGKKKQPYYFRLRDETPFAFAGLWEHWERDGQVVESCTIITTEANDLARPYHDRMPVILPADARALWLDTDIEEPRALQDLLRPYPAEEMRFDPVNPVVNSARNEGPECIRPVAA